MLQVTARNKYIVDVALLPGLNPFDLVVLEAVGPCRNVGILCCEDPFGNRFSYLGPVAALDGVPLDQPIDPGRLTEAFPLYRPSWPY